MPKMPTPTRNRRTDGAWPSKLPRISSAKGRSACRGHKSKDQSGRETRNQREQKYNPEWRGRIGRTWMKICQETNGEKRANNGAHRIAGTLETKCSAARFFRYRTGQDGISKWVRKPLPNQPSVRLARTSGQPRARAKRPFEMP